jgi:predicted oxidoreductase
MSLRSDEIWERLLALSGAELRASIRECGLYLASPEGVAEFGLLQVVGRAECEQIYGEALRQSASLQKQFADLPRCVERLEAAK